MGLKATFALMSIALAVLAGCGQSSADKAKSQVCDARDDIATQVKQLQGLTLGTATKSKVSDSLKAIQKDLQTIANASGDLKDQFKQDVQSANQQFEASVKNTVSDVGGTVSLKTAAAQIQTALKQLATSYQNTFGKLQCS